MRKRINNRGFSLIELVVVITLLGLMAGLISTIIRQPIESYRQTTALSQTADLANYVFEQLREEISNALPNSLRVKSQTNANGETISYLELIPIKGGGVYVAEPAPHANIKALGFDAIENEFFVEGYSILASNRLDELAWVVVGNQSADEVQSPDLDIPNAYIGNNRAQCASSSVEVCPDCTVCTFCNCGFEVDLTNILGQDYEYNLVQFIPHSFPLLAQLESRRFFVTSNPVSFVCSSTGYLHKISYYPFSEAQRTVFDNEQDEIGIVAAGYELDSCQISFNEINQEVSVTLGVNVGGNVTTHTSQFRTSYSP